MIGLILLLAGGMIFRSIASDTARSGGFDSGDVWAVVGAYYAVGFGTSALLGTLIGVVAGAIAGGVAHASLKRRAIRAGGDVDFGCVKCGSMQVEPTPGGLECFECGHVG